MSTEKGVAHQCSTHATACDDERSRDMTKTSLRALLAVGLSLAGTAAAQPYVLVVRESPSEYAKRERTDAVGASYWTAYAAFGEQLRAAGVLRGGSPVGAPVAAVPARLSPTASRARSDVFVMSRLLSSSHAVACVEH
jgi:hypothetical protein